MIKSSLKAQLHARNRHTLDALSAGSQILKNHHTFRKVRLMGAAPVSGCDPSLSGATP